MNPGSERTPALPLDVVDAATVFGLLGGGLSLFFPFFQGLTVALVALALVGWLTRFSGARANQTAGSAASPRRPLPVVSLSLLGAGWVAFLAVPVFWSFPRGAVLALSLVPLSWFERSVR